ncbi:NBR1-Ig-like domain-containing protein [Actinomadura sp. NEAU-AAG7]|uniref:NBR1-Ig-like domain-containing protein n=1 Tax=Actinomadura sp. NEAU-AAG7 TaxID=2839640 RepID=UPI001BE4CED0|nr:NBR1-Ig-like domain-containing protein [Actinomadura sp. NEAU-AAG7]MBT2213522.1 helix-turn-helix domain-containing protein [Actinomadura sp. NEAU-AAG7]
MSDSGALPSTGGQDARDRFAERLRRLRAEAGNPSFRVMAAKSRSVSHATLHEAAKGTRFPSWTTTQAFVEACGGDVEEWREHWCAALGSDAVASGAPAAAVPGSGAEEGGDESAVVPTPGPARRRRRRVIAIVAGCGALGGAGVGVSLLLASGGQPEPKVGAEARKTTMSTAPLFSGDASAFVGDVTIPDGTVVRTGQRFIKTWELKNAGAVHWHGRFLQRAALPADNGTCLTPAKVPIPDTGPGARVRISVPVTAPAAPGSCWVAWKMVDGEGRQLFPSARPVYFVVNVVR